VGGYAPRAREDSVRPRRLPGASARPLNFTVRGHWWGSQPLLRFSERDSVVSSGWGNPGHGTASDTGAELGYAHSVGVIVADTVPN